MLALLSTLVASQVGNNSTAAGSSVADALSGVNARVPTVVKLGSDVVTTSNVLSDITGLSFPVTVGVQYWFHAYFAFQSIIATTGAQFAVTGPAAPTLFIMNNWTSTNTSASVQTWRAGYDLAAAGTTVSVANTTYPATMEGTVIPSISGTMQLRFASSVNTSQITVKAGSLLFWLAV